METSKWLRWEHGALLVNASLASTQKSSQTTDDPRLAWINVEKCGGNHGFIIGKYMEIIGDDQKFYGCKLWIQNSNASSRPGEVNFGSQIHLDSIWLIGFSRTVHEIFSNHINHHFSMISPFLARKSLRLPSKKLTFDVFFWSHSATNKPQNNSIWDPKRTEPVTIHQGFCC